jgi:hypothetical protein
MEELYDEIREDPLYARLFELANVHTAEEFGCDVPEDAYEQMASAIEDGGDWVGIREEDWFTAAQTTADEQDFFHWELEFPEVFFDSEGEKMGEAGFDAVVGNPPYVKIQNIRQSNPKLADYATDIFQSSTGRFDLYSLFVEKGHQIALNGNLGYILPNKFFESGAGKGLRKYLMTEGNYPRKILNFGQTQVFDGATTYTCLLFLSGEGTVEYGKVAGQRDVLNPKEIPLTQIDSSDLDDGGWILTDPEQRQVMKKMRETGVAVGDRTSFISEGIVSGDNDVMFVDVESWGEEVHTVRSNVADETFPIEAEIARPLRDGDEIERYGSVEADQAVIYPYQIEGDESELISENKLEGSYPKAYSYLDDHKKRLADRGSESMNYPAWYALWCPRDKRIFESSKLLVPDICGRSEFTYDESGGTYVPNSAYSVVPANDSTVEQEYLLAVLNSSPTWFYLYHTSPVLRGDYRRFMTSYLSPIPLPDDSQKSMNASPKEIGELWKKYLPEKECPSTKSKKEYLAKLARLNLDNHTSRRKLNTDFLDYIEIRDSKRSITELGLFQPASGSRSSNLNKQKGDLNGLRMGAARVHRESPNTVLIEATARYKPDDEDAHETDQWGYTETEYLPAFRITDLTEREADLIEHFVPVAVDEAGGFANFRETATKTNSLIDRLKAIELPDVDDVADDLENYLRTKERAEELDEKIEKTDELIDKIVYELYGLTDEEIEIVEEAVSE